MNARCRCALVAATLLAASSAAHAIPTLTLVRPYPVSQIGQTSSLNAGLTVVASTAWYVLTVGGGYTITCSGSSLSITAQNSNAIASVFGNLELLITVPGPVPASYPILGWSSLPAGQCKQCTFLYTGRAVDASASIAANTLGASFRFDAGGEVSRGDTLVFRVCRPAPNNWDGPRGCIP